MTITDSHLVELYKPNIFRKSGALTLTLALMLFLLLLSGCTEGSLNNHLSSGAGDANEP